MLFQKLISVAALATAASAKFFYVGVAQSSGEFGVWSENKQKGFGLPGKFGTDYAFIDKKGIDTYVDQNKVNLFRIAFLLERMCPVAGGLGAKFNETHFDYFKEAVDYVTVTKGAYCILDPHNYMRYNDPSQQPMTGSIIGDTADKTAATTAQFGAFWGELAGRFKDNEKVIFGLMNEPHDMKTSLVIQNNQAAIDAIRKAGAKQLILAPGNSWSGGHYWTKGNDPNTQLTKLKDPENNLAFDIHEYLDEDYSGSHTDCKKPATELDGVTNWLKQNKYKAMITEFGGSNTTQCAQMLGDLVKYMDKNEVYLGWTAWAAGPFWGSNSACCTDQKQWGSLEPTSKASDGSPGLYETVWLKTLQPLVPKQLVWSGISSVNGGTLSEKPATSKRNTGSTY